MMCVICRRGMSDGVSLYRINAKGVKGLWACAEHISRTDAPKLDPEVIEIVDILERSK